MRIRLRRQVFIVKYILQVILTFQNFFLATTKSDRIPNQDNFFKLILEDDSESGKFA